MWLLGEGRVPREISFQELHVRVGEIAAALKTFGVKQGDRIAGMLMDTHNVTYYYMHSSLDQGTCPTAHWP